MPCYQAIQEFLNDQTSPIVDVRSPVEFRRAHIPGAVNLPLFSDQQRQEVGTLYKNAGRVASIHRALQFITPRLEGLAESARKIADRHRIRLHCWRGGMRSRSTAWLFEKIDLQPVVLQGGYKSFRRHVVESFKQPLPLLVLSGLTGSGKTQQLQVLQMLGEQVLDLEAIANHRGSAFGGIGLGQQPTVEHFENNLYQAIQRLDRTRPIWVEDESRSVGNIRLPHHFFESLRAAPAFFMKCSRETRVELIMNEYGKLPIEQLVAATQRVRRRMGGQNMKQAVEAIESGNLRAGVEVLLDYYDRLYLENKSKMKRESFLDVDVEDPISTATGLRLVNLARQTMPHFALPAPG